MIYDFYETDDIQCSALIFRNFFISPHGPVAQLGERSVRNRKAEGSNPFGSTRKLSPRIYSEGISLWSWKRDSNTRPAHYECAALPTELFQHIDFAFKIILKVSPLIKRFYRKKKNFSLHTIIQISGLCMCYNQVTLNEGDERYGKLFHYDYRYKKLLRLQTI